jgi:hypothetical protein
MDCLPLWPVLRSYRIRFLSGLRRNTAGAAMEAADPPTPPVRPPAATTSPDIGTLPCPGGGQQRAAASHPWWRPAACSGQPARAAASSMQRPACQGGGQQPASVSHATLEETDTMRSEKRPQG